MNHYILDYLELSKSKLNPEYLEFVFNSFIVSSQPEFIFKNLSSFIRFGIAIVRKTENQSNNNKIIKNASFIKNIGEALNSIENLDVSNFDSKQLLLDTFYKITASVESSSFCVSCYETYVEIVAKYCDIKQTNCFLGSIISRMLPNHQFEQYSAKLLNILSRLVQVANLRHFHLKFYSMSNLMPFLDLLNKENERKTAAKIIVEGFICSLDNYNDSKKDDSLPQAGLDSDPVLLNSLVHLCKIMHDSINVLSLEDEIRQFSTLIIGFIRRVDFDQDFENQLNFYVECRASFCNLDSVLCFLVHKVNGLAMQTHRVVKGYHSKRTISFVNGCIAYSYITIASIEEITTRMELYLNSASVALINVCLGQADSFIKSAITLLNELPSYREGSDGKRYCNDTFFFQFASQLMSILIVVPVSHFRFESHSISLHSFL